MVHINQAFHRMLSKGTCTLFFSVAVFVGYNIKIISNKCHRQRNSADVHQVFIHLYSNLNAQQITSYSINLYKLLKFFYMFTLATFIAIQSFRRAKSRSYWATPYSPQFFWLKFSIVVNVIIVCFFQTSETSHPINKFQQHWRLNG